jgi:hypothetical protein
MGMDIYPEVSKIRVSLPVIDQKLAQLGDIYPYVYV